MFEKCGIKDIAYRLYMWRRVIAICSALVVLLAVGIYFLGGSNSADLQQLTQENANSSQHAERNYAYYYVSLDLEQEQDIFSGRKDQEAYFASVYKQNMNLYPTMEGIYTDMLKKYSAEELSLGINKTLFKNYNADFISMFKAACQINTVGNSVIEIYVITDDKEIGQELLRVCKEKLEALQSEVSGSKLNYIGDFYSNKAVEQETRETEQIDAYLKGAEKQQQTHGTQKAVLLLIAWIVAVLIAATVSAIFFPTINYESDFELYGVNSLGVVSRKNASAFAVRLQHAFMSTGSNNIGLLTTREDTPKFREQCKNLTDQLNKLGIVVRYGADGSQSPNSVPCVTILSRPNENGEVLKMMMQCDVLGGLEVAGKSLHNEFDELTHFVSGMPVQMKEAILIK